MPGIEETVYGPITNYAPMPTPPKNRGPNQVWEARYDPATASIRCFCKVCDATYPGHTPGCALQALEQGTRRLKALLGEEGPYSVCKSDGTPMGVGEYFEVANVFEDLDAAMARVSG